MIRACDGHRGRGEGGCGFRSSGLREADGDACPLCGGALVEMAPPAPRRPVAGWVKPWTDAWILGVSTSESGEVTRAIVSVSVRRCDWREDDPWHWSMATPGVDGHRFGQAPTLEAAQLAAEDALLAVLTDAAVALGKRVVS